MNINDLIGANPELRRELLSLGLTPNQVDDLGLQITAQLRDRSTTQLSELLVQLNAEAFLDRLDVEALATELDCDMAVIQSALIRLASIITLFNLR